MDDVTKEPDPLGAASIEDAPVPPPSVVAIASSASGLPALRDFLGAVPPDVEIAIVVVPLVNPDEAMPSMDLEIAPATRLPIQLVAQTAHLEPAHVYIVPPRRLASLDGNTLVVDPERPLNGAMPVDRLFRSLAEQKRERAIGVILAGPGSDGSLGVRAIESAGGIVLVRNPDGIADPQMPRNAIATGVVDYVLPPERMPEIIARYSRHPYGEDPAAGDGDAGLDAVLAIIRETVGSNFNSYKRTTVGRRVQRRMGLAQFTSYAEYAEFLKSSPREIDELFGDLLICVTQFFRDREAWQVLRTEVIEDLVRRRGDNEAIRVWTPGCATGEESYTIAILLLDEVRKQKKLCTVQVFASDISDRVLSIARLGLYPESIAADVPPEYLERYFERIPGDHQYSIAKVVRESVIFAQQNLVSDPPFSKLDLVVCRNLLIYLRNDVQHKVIALFHFALRQGGYLMLGSAETIGRHEGLFSPTSKKWRLFRRVDRHGDSPELPMATTGRRIAHAAGTPSRSAPIDPKVARIAQQVLLESFAPAAVLINRRFEVLYYSGPTSQYLTQPPGAPTTDLLMMARDGIRIKLRPAVQNALETRQPTSVHNVRIKRGGTTVHVSFTLHPIRADHDGEPLLLVVFRDEHEPPSLHEPRGEERPDAATDGEETDETLVRQLEYELRLTRDELQSHIEQLETSNEELKSANEEVMSINEELQSMNEELETSKEELQSLNEELGTVNHQLQEKLEEIERINGDLTNLLSSTDIATIFLDRSLRIKRFTPSVRRLLNIIPSDVGRPIANFTRKFADPTLLSDLGAVLERLVPSEVEVRADDGCWYLRRAVPYRTDDNRIDGLVITFVDITDRRDAAEALVISENRYRMLVDSATDFAIFMIDIDGRITTWNTGAERICGFLEREAVGRPCSIIFVAEDLAKGEDVKELERAREHGRSLDERWHQRKDGTRFWGSGVVTAIYDVDGKLHGFAKVMRDQTERRRMESELKQLNETLEQMVQDRTSALRALSSELLLAEERERRELAADLHDSIGQSLALAAIRLKQANVASDDAARNDLLALIDQANQAVRSVTMQLSPPILYQIGLVPALEWLAEEMDRRYGLTVVLESRGIPAEIDDQVRFILFRSARELLINVAKHAGVTDARVRIGSIDGNVLVEVEDSGSGFEATGERLMRRGAGFGLFSLRERLGYIGGEVIIRSTPGIGTAVVLRSPARILRRPDR